MAATLTGIRKGQGNCDHCDRELTARIFTVNIDGQEVGLGRRCAAKATGYRTDAIEQEARRIVRMAEVASRKTTIATQYPTLATDQIANIATDDLIWNTGEWTIAAKSWSSRWGPG